MRQSALGLEVLCETSIALVRIPRIQRSTLLGQLSVILLVSTSGLQLAAQELSIKRLDGSTISPAEVDSTVSRLMQAAEVTGVGIAIFNDGKIAYLKTYGARDKEKNLPITPDSVITAASLSKAAFMTMVMELVEKGILDLDKPVYQYLPKPLRFSKSLARNRSDKPIL